MFTYLYYLFTIPFTTNWRNSEDVVFFLDYVLPVYIVIIAAVVALYIKFN